MLTGTLPNLEFNGEEKPKDWQSLYKRMRMRGDPNSALIDMPQDRKLRPNKAT